LPCPPGATRVMIPANYETEIPPIFPSRSGLNEFEQLCDH